jgi:heme exporter protein A
VSGGPLLGIEDVACIRGGRLLFEGIRLELEAGGAAVVTGPNGAGKSSLIRLAAGLLRPAAGSVRRGAAAAMADEALALDRRQPLSKALAFWARLDGGNEAAGIEAMGLGQLRDVPVRMLSSGQRKRAALARVVASGAPLWLLDEPLNALDSEGVDRLAEAMAAHRRGGGAILAATHQPIGLDGAREVRLG